MRLAARPKPYWRGLEEGLHLGYRKPRQGSGSWLARVRTDAGAYRESVLGTADDFDDADGTVVFSYAQAQTMARAARIARERAELGVEAVSHKGPDTVADALKDYETDFVQRGGKALHTIKSVASAHIIPVLGNVELSKLSTSRIRSWHAGLASGQAMLRSKAGKARTRRAHTTQDLEAVRRRRSSANRILTVLKAALNLAFAEGRVAGDDAWRRVKPFANVESARIRSLSVEESTRFINACEPEFRPLIRAALLTGARYGELTQIRVVDFNPNAGTVFIAQSKSGKARHIPLSDEGVDFFRQVTGSRRGSETMFLRGAISREPPTRGRSVRRAWRKSEQKTPMKKASAAAQIEPGVTFHCLRHTYASLLVSADVSLAFVSEVLGHADTRVTSKHYAHLAPSSVATAIRAHLPRFTADESAKREKTDDD